MRTSGFVVVGVKQPARKSLSRPLACFVLGALACLAVGADSGSLNQSLIQAFGGPLNLRDATAGQVPVKQADGSWAPGAGGGGGGTDLTGLGTDNVLARWNGADTLQTSCLTVSDQGTVTWSTGLVSPAIQGPSDARFEVLAGTGRSLRVRAGSSGALEMGAGSSDYLTVDSTGVAVVGSTSFYGSGVSVAEGFRKRLFTYTGGSGAATTLTHSQSGSIVCNTGATAEVYVNLPTLDGAEDVGIYYTFDCTAASAGSYGLRFVAASGDTITVGTDTSASAGYVRTTVVGSVVTIYANSTSNWRAVSGSLGPWEVN